jgi:hypothetical protein
VIAALQPIMAIAWHNWLVRHGTTAQEWVDDSLRTAEEATAGLERLRAVVTSYQNADPEKVANEDFEYGLERVLDGLQARLDRRP